MLIEKQPAWPLWSSSRAVVNSASSFSKSPRCFTLQITQEVEPVVVLSLRAPTPAALS
jgi:hypothetical protein